MNHAIQMSVLAAEDVEEASGSPIDIEHEATSLSMMNIDAQLTLWLTQEQNKL